MFKRPNLEVNYKKRRNNARVATIQTCKTNYFDTIFNHHSICEFWRFALEAY